MEWLTGNQLVYARYEQFLTRDLVVLQTTIPSRGQSFACVLLINTHQIVAAY